MKIYYDEDADLKVLKGKKVAIVGYGIQGRGQGLNLRDSGVEVLIAQRKGGKNYDLAIEDGFDPITAEDAAQRADIVQVLAQDHLQAEIYGKSIRPSLKAGKALLFSHGFNIHFGYIKPPKEVDVYMVAPKGPGALVRTQFLEGGGVPCLVAIHQNPSGKALQLALAHAKAIGGTRAGVIETSFKEETETDLFGEQVVLCGGLSELIRAGFETLVEAGYARQKGELLEQASRKVNSTRYLLRMAKDLKLMSIDAYGFSAEKLDEIGRMVGGWSKAAAKS